MARRPEGQRPVVGVTPGVGSLFKVAIDFIAELLLVAEVGAF